MSISWNCSHLVLVEKASMATPDLGVPPDIGLPEGQIVQVYQGEMFVPQVDPKTRGLTGKPQEFKLKYASQPA